MTARIAAVFSFSAILFFAALLASLHRAPIASARPAPHFQSGTDFQSTAPAPTEEPTKPPYLFPTPVFIPTYPGAIPAATPTPTRAAGPLSGEQTYTVEPGDNPWIIAKKVYGDATKYPLILSANDLTDATKLRVGTVLVIPAVAGRGQPAPTPTASPLAPTQTPTVPSGQPSVPTIAPTPPASLSPTSAAANLIPAPITEIALTAINILSGIFLVGSMLSATLAFLIFRRARRLERTTRRVRRIRVR